MALNTNGGRDGFTSRFGIIAAIAGSAVGLGNIWRFPYVASENGGGAFLMLYIACILAIGIPVLLSELLIGRNTQSNTYRAFKKLAPKSAWPIIGIMGITAAFVILSFYSTVAGWTLEYVVRSFESGFSGKSSAELKDGFDSFITNPYKPLIWQMVFMALTGLIVIMGVQKGIEKYSKILMPMLVILILIMCGRSLTLPGGMEGLKFFLTPDFSKINGDVILKAMGQAAFSLSIGMGAIITYGSYIPKNNKLSNTSFQISIADSIIAILSGIIVFPAIFSFGINPQEGAGLAFIVFPSIFAQMPAGEIFAVFFFILLAVASLTSTISLLEVVVAVLTEETKLNRKKATYVGVISISAIGVLCTLSFSVLKDFKIAGLTIFELFDYSSANILLPLGALLIVIFTGWFMKKSILKAELSNQGELKVKIFGFFYFIVRYVAPIVIIIVFLKTIGFLN